MEGVSVIIPCYNKEKYIEKCINSVAAQSYKNIEIIVVDDCSTDKSYTIAKHLEQKFSNLKVSQNKKNMGVSATRNHGATYAKAKYITFLDADDYYANPKKIENEMKICIARGINSISFSNFYAVNSAGTKIIKRYTMPKQLSGARLRLNNILSIKFIYCRDYILSKELFENVGGYKIDCNLFEDFDLILKLSYICNFYNTGEWGTAYRYLENGLSSKTYEESIAAQDSILLDYMSKYSLFIRKILWTARKIIRTAKRLFKNTLFYHGVLRNKKIRKRE